MKFQFNMTKSSTLYFNHTLLRISKQK